MDVKEKPLQIGEVLVKFKIIFLKLSYLHPCIAL